MKRNITVENPARCRLNHEHTHEKSSTCYNRGGCRCQPCRRKKSRDRAGDGKLRNYIAGRDILHPAAPSRRRLQALAYAGYGAREIQALTGMHDRHLSGIRDGEYQQVRSSTAARITDFYHNNILTPSSDPRAAFVRTIAQRNGWKSFAEWEDIEKGTQ